MSDIQTVLSPVTVAANKQGNKVLEALRRAFHGGGVFIFLSAVQGEKTQLPRVEALEGCVCVCVCEWEVHSDCQALP